MMKYLSYLIPWTVVSLLGGAAGHYFFKIDFWLASIIIGATMTINGLFAEWEDRDM